MSNKYFQYIATFISSMLFLILSIEKGNCQQKQHIPLLGKCSINEVIAAMTLEEKAAMVVGTGLKIEKMAVGGELNIPNQPIPGSLADKTKIHVNGAVGRTLETPRLGISTIEMVDGPAGPSFGMKTTAFPIATNLSSTWDVDLVREVGNCMGNEVAEYGLDMLLAPAMNIQRNSLTGRNFEYYSEDPLLSGKMGASIVKGIQFKGVGTSVKHFVANNQETNRISIDAIISERALREIYLRGFEIAVKESDPWSLMASYNSVNGSLATENYELLTKIAREEWGYQGIIMSDWEAGNNPVKQMNAGLNLIMPGPYQDTAIINAVKNGQLKEEILDQNIAWILKNTMRFPKFRRYRFSGKPDLENSVRVARKAGADGMVLLKNENKALPLFNKTSKIALFGNGSYKTNIGGAGSGYVMRHGPIVNFIVGLKCAGFSIEEKSLKVYNDYIQKNTPIQILMQEVRGRIKRAPEMNVTSEFAEEISNDADVAIITIRRTSEESVDRKIKDDFNLSEIELSNIKNISAAFHSKGKKVVVVLNIGGVIETASWKNLVDAILIAWLPGQEAGNAITDVLTGKVNPSGKLPVTFPIRYEDEPSSKNFPGTPIEDPKQVVYEEGIYVGYRYFNTFKKETSFPFGYGLSYTDFNYSDLSLSSESFNDSIQINLTVTNSGDKPGKEVVEFYLNAPNVKLDKPSEELKGFAKTKLLNPGESQILQFNIHLRDLTSFDSNQTAWIAQKGEYEVRIGSSSEEIRLKKKFSLNDEILVQKVNKVLVPKIEINELGKTQPAISEEVMQYLKQQGIDPYVHVGPMLTTKLIKAKVNIDCTCKLGEFTHLERYNNFESSNEFVEQRDSDVEFYNSIGLHGEIYRVWLIGNSFYNEMTGQVNISTVSKYLTDASKISDYILLNCSNLGVVKGWSDNEEEKTIRLTKILKELKFNFPQIKYIEVTNEPDYSHEGVTPENYYNFYKIYNNAVNKVNAELKPKIPLLIGGPSVSQFSLEWLRPFLDAYAKDSSPDKRLDFISYHGYYSKLDTEYNLFKDDPSVVKGQREMLNKELKNRGISIEIPVFVTETGMYPGPAFDDFNTIKNDHLRQASGMASLLYWYLNTNDNTYPFNWVMRHRKEGRKDQLVTRDQWQQPFVNTRKFTPYGNMMLMMSKMKKNKISSNVTSTINKGKGLYSLATSDSTGVSVMIWNYQGKGTEGYDAEINIENLPKSLKGKKFSAKIYRIDEKTSNYHSDPANCNLQLVDTQLMNRAIRYHMTLHLEPNTLQLVIFEKAK